MLFSEKKISLADEKNEDKNIFAFELEFQWIMLKAFNKAFSFTQY